MDRGRHRDRRHLHNALVHNSIADLDMFHVSSKNTDCFYLIHLSNFPALLAFRFALYGTLITSCGRQCLVYSSPLCLFLSRSRSASLIARRRIEENKEYTLDISLLNSARIVLVEPDICIDVCGLQDENTTWTRLFQSEGN